MKLAVNLLADLKHFIHLELCAPQERRKDDRMQALLAAVGIYLSF